MTNKNEQAPLVSIKGLKKYFKISGGILKAVDGVSFDIYKGETLGLVGESGCGKSTIGRTVLRMYGATAGNIIFEGRDITTMTPHQLKDIKKDMQLIFQDPYSSLNPRMTVADIIAEPMDINKTHTGEARRERVQELLDLVGLKGDHGGRFPHEFSGGQRQRICIARALSINPKFVVCDEPISSLDVSIQAQIVNLLKELQEKIGLTYLFIAHDLSMVRYISDRILVMYLGNMVELAKSGELNDNPLHPYTKGLISSVPDPDPSLREDAKKDIIEGEIPSPINPPKGCVFVTRCHHAMEVCKNSRPEWKEVEKDHFVACYLYEK